MNATGSKALIPIRTDPACATRLSPPWGTLRRQMLVVLGAGPVSVATLAFCASATEDYTARLLRRLQVKGKVRPAGFGFRRGNRGAVPMLWELVP
jgi:hypothetical protein